MPGSRRCCWVPGTRVPAAHTALHTWLQRALATAQLLHVVVEEHVNLQRGYKAEWASCSGPRRRRAAAAAAREGLQAGCAAL